MTELELNALGQQQRKMMEIIWQRGGATVQEVLDAVNAENSPPLAYTTVLATMQKLEKAGWLNHASDPAHGRAYVYHATKSRNEVIGSSLRQFAENFLGGSKTLLFQHFFDDAGLSDEEIEEIRNVMAKRVKKTIK